MGGIYTQFETTARELEKILTDQQDSAGVSSDGTNESLKPTNPEKIDQEIKAVVALESPVVFEAPVVQNSSDSKHNVHPTFSTSYVANSYTDDMKAASSLKNEDLLQNLDVERHEKETENIKLKEEIQKKNEEIRKFKSLLKKLKEKMIEDKKNQPQEIPEQVLAGISEQNEREINRMKLELDVDHRVKLERLERLTQTQIAFEKEALRKDLSIAEAKVVEYEKELKTLKTVPPIEVIPKQLRTDLETQFKLKLEAIEKKHLEEKELLQMQIHNIENRLEIEQSTYQHHTSLLQEKDKKIQSLNETLLVIEDKLRNYEGGTNIKALDEPTTFSPQNFEIQDELQLKIKDLEKQVSEDKSSLQESHSIMQNLERKNQEIQEQFGEKINELESKWKAERDEANKLFQLERQSRLKLENEKEYLTQLNEQLSLQFTKLKTDLENINQMKDETFSSNSNEKIMELEQEIQRLKTMNENLAEEKSSLLKSFERLQETHDVEKSRLQRDADSKLNFEIDSSKQRMESFREELMITFQAKKQEALTEAEKKLNFENQLALQQLENSHRKLQVQLEDQVAMLNSELANLKQASAQPLNMPENGKNNTDVAFLQEAFNTIFQDLIGSSEEVEILIGRLQNTENLKSSLDTLKKVESTLINERDELKSQVSQLQDLNEALSAEKINLVTDLEFKTNEISNSKLLSESIRITSIQQQTQLDELKLEHENHLLKYQELKSFCDEIVSVRDIKSAEVDELKQQVEEKAMMLASFQTEITSVTANMNILKSELENSSETSSIMQRHIDEMKLEITEKSSLIVQLQNQVKVMVEQLEQKQCELNNLQSTETIPLSIHQECLKNNEETLETLRSELREQVNAFNLVEETNKREIEGLLQEKESLALLKLTFEAELGVKDEAIANLNLELSKLEKECKVFNFELENKVKDLDFQAKANAEELDEKNQSIASLNAEVSRLNEVKDRLEAAKMNLETEYSSLKLEIEALRNATDYQSKFQELEEEYKQYKEKAEVALNSLVAEVEEYRMKLESTEKRVQDYLETSHRAEISDLRAQYETALKDQVAESQLRIHSNLNKMATLEEQISEFQRKSLDWKTERDTLFQHYETEREKLYHEYQRKIEERVQEIEQENHRKIIEIERVHDWKQKEIEREDYDRNEIEQNLRNKIEELYKQINELKDQTQESIREAVVAASRKELSAPGTESKPPRNRSNSIDSIEAGFLVRTDSGSSTPTHRTFQNTPLNIISPASRGTNDPSSAIRLTFTQLRTAIADVYRRGDLSGLNRMKVTFGILIYSVVVHLSIFSLWWSCKFGH